MAWYAICPKCEKFHKLEAYRPDFYCPHPKDMIGILDKKFRPDSLDCNSHIDKIKCKVVNMVMGSPFRKGGGLDGDKGKVF